MMEKLTLLVNVAVTGFLTGLIWTIQVVHYPLFAEVGADYWQRYHEAHNLLISVVVVAPMLVELAAALALVAWRPAAVPAWLAWAGLALTGVAWLNTFLMAVPLHGALTYGLDPALVHRLVMVNWVRTAAWSARWALLLGAVWLALER